MTAAVQNTQILGQWAEDPVRLCPEDECRRARLAWEKVAPEDGQLPPDATPLQCMLYARMTTSIFIYAAGRIRNGERTTTVLP
jgi:hypothetical protein